MIARDTQGGYTLAELLVGLAIAALIVLPLADMLRTGADSARLVHTRLDLNADADFALDRLAASAARYPVAPPPPPGEPAATTAQQDWLKALKFEECKDTRQLLENSSCAKSVRDGVVASHVDKVEVTAPADATGALTLRIALTLSHPDALAPVSRTRIVRAGVLQ